MNQVSAIATAPATSTASAAHATAPRPPPAPAGQEGLQACVHTWSRARGLDAAFWLGLPTRDADSAPSPDLGALPGLGSPSYAGIALEAGHTMTFGVGAASAQALVLLAAVALDRCCGAEAAIELARTACRLAASTREARAVRTLYAMLIAPRAGELHQAVATLAGLCQENGPDPVAALGLAGAGFGAGMAPAVLMRHLDLCLAHPAPGETAQAAALELAGRARLLHALATAQAGVPAHSGADGPAQEGRFGHWLTRLQAAWYDGDTALAQLAAMRAAPLADPLTPAADLACYHLFAALAVARAPAALDTLRRHCAALNALAPRFTQAAAMAELVSALIDRRAGDTVAALRGFERAAASATRRTQHWLAALAAEQAARQADDVGLATVTRHYRREALASCVQWGAYGRAEALCRAWGETMPRPARAPDAAAAMPAASPAGGSRIELGASIAHEVNQPLAAIALHAAAARKCLRLNQPDIERALASLALISSAGRQAGDIVRSVRRLATHQDSEVEPVKVDAALADALLVLEHPLRCNGIELDTAFGLGGCAIQANRAQVQQVVTNLVLNAIEALAEAGPHSRPRRIGVATYRYNDDMVEISVTDNGAGIAPADHARVFERLYTTKPGNTGMGLAISLAIAHAHKGVLALEDCQPHGACFRLRLPVRSPVGA